MKKDIFLGLAVGFLAFNDSGRKITKMITNEGGKMLSKTFTSIQEDLKKAMPKTFEIFDKEENEVVEDETEKSEE